MARYAQITALGFSDNLPYEKIGKNEPVCIADEVPFDIPESWEWCRIGELFFLQAGKNISSSSISEKPFANAVPCYGGNGIRGYVKESNHRGDYPIIGRQGALCGNINRATGDFYATEHAVCVTTFSNTNVSWACIFLKALNLNQYATATAQPGLAVGTINRVLIPVPPVTEQKRITEKLYLLEPLLASYENAHDLIVNQQHDFPEQLKKSILQDAVQGKLVPQDPADEPASVLLERIRTEKEKLIKAGKIKRDKHESVIFRRDNSYYEKIDEIERCIDDEIPFEIPESWGWCRLKSLTENITSGSRDWAKYYSTTGAAFLRMGNLSKNSFDLRLEHIQRVTIPSKAEGTRTSLQSGDLLFSITGDVGMLGLIPDGFEKAYINQHTAMIRFLPEMRNKYIPYLLLTDYAQKFYNANQHGIKNSFRLDSIGELLVSIPPEKELFRILQRISLVLSKIAVL